LDGTLFDVGEPLKRCSRCRRYKPLTEFHRDRSRKDGVQNYCKACNIARAKRFYAENPERCKDRDKRRKPGARDLNRTRVLRYLLEHPCVDCGETDPVVLEFDHLRDKVKALSVLAATAHSWQRILAEIEKCEVRCANCHRRKTAQRAGNFRWRMTRGG
jgi:hypothetical protein